MTTKQKTIYFPEIGQRFKETRKRAGLTQQEAADLLNINLSTLKSFEYGYSSPNIEFLRAWHQKLNCSYKWILEGKDGKEKKGTN